MIAETVDIGALAARLHSRAVGGSRVLLGVCGAPGAGKSTLAGQLVAELNRVVPGSAVVVPMDGFHLAASVIAVDDRATRRGAPDTFDPGGLAALLQRVRAGVEEIVYAPEYRREIEDPVAGAIEVRSDCPIVVVEGNYLLLPEWESVRVLLDEVWFLRAPAEEQRVAQLIQRHQAFGKTSEHARRHVLGTDERNAELVAGHADRADLVLRWPAW